MTSPAESKAPAAYRFRDGLLVVSDDIEWPLCSHQLGLRADGNFCEADAENGFISTFSADLAFACKLHTFPAGGQDYWPLIAESETR